MRLIYRDVWEDGEGLPAGVRSVPEKIELDPIFAELGELGWKHVHLTTVETIERETLHGWVDRRARIWFVVRREDES